MLRMLLAIIMGGIAGVVAIMLLEPVATWIFPTPGGFDLSKPGATAIYMDIMPLGAQILLLTIWALASFIASAFATRMARRHSVRPGLAAAAIVLLAGVIDMVTLPRPVWMVLAGFAALILPAYVAALIFARKTAVAA